MGVFGKPSIDKLKSKGDVKALQKVLLSQASRVQRDTSGDSLRLVIDSSLALLDLDATGVLREVFRIGLSGYCIQEILKAFVAQNPEKARPVLIDLWFNHKEQSVRDLVESHLAGMPNSQLDAGTVASLVAVLRAGQSSPGILTLGGRKMAARCLTGVRDADAVDALVASFNTPYEDLRSAAAAALRGMGAGDKAALAPTLVHRLQDERVWERRNAIEALTALGWVDAVEPIAQLLTDPDASVRTSAAHALAGFGDLRGRDALLAETESNDAGARARAIASLGDTLGAADIPMLLRLLRDPAMTVRELAANRLAALDWVPTLDEAGAYFFLARGEVKGCLRVGAKASGPLLDYLSLSLGGYDVDSLALYEVAAEVADRRVVPVLQKLLEKRKKTLSLLSAYLRTEGDTDPSSPFCDWEVKALATVIARILKRSEPVASPAWIEVMDLATLPLGKTLLVDQGKLDVSITCPSCEGTVLARAAYRSADASFLVCPRCGDDWLIRSLTGRYERTEAALPTHREVEVQAATEVVPPPQPSTRPVEHPVQPLVLTMTGHDRGVDACAFSPDGQRIVSGSADMTLKLWDAETGTCQATLVGHGAFVTACAFSPDGRRIVSSGADKTLKLWDAETGTCQATLVGHGDMVAACAFSPDGRRIVSASWDKTLKLWDAETGTCERTLVGHDDATVACAFSPDGRRIVSGSHDTTLKLWDAETGACERTLVGHDNLVLACAFSPDGRRIVSGSGNKTLKLWDAETGTCQATLVGHGAKVAACAFSPDGRRIVSSGDDKTLKLWDVAFGTGSASPARRSATETTVELASPASGGEVVEVAVIPAGRFAVSGGKVARSLDEVVGEIVTLDGQLNRLATEGRGNSDPEWSRCDDRLTAIGKELYAEGGEAQMGAALQLAYQKGMRGRYVDRHWTGIGTWMG